MLSAARRLNQSQRFLLRPSVNGTSLSIAWRSTLKKGPKPPQRKFEFTEVDRRLVRDRKNTIKGLGQVACTGCGAPLQSEDFRKMGYMSAIRIEQCAKFESTPKTPFPPYVCLRCHTLRHSADGVHVEMKEKEYRMVMSKRITEHNCLILWLVDITDFPSSLFKGIADIIGPNNPIILVATKVDLLGDLNKGLVSETVRECMLEGWRESGLADKCQLVALHMISASTGFGVGNLLKDVSSHWKNRGDVFVVGSANAGKSTLFNRIMPLMCGMSASHRGGATVAKWPGTTLRMIRFPMIAFSEQMRLKEQARAEVLRRLQQGEEERKQKQPALQVLQNSQPLFSDGFSHLDKWKHGLAPDVSGVCSYTSRDVEDIFNPQPGMKAVYETHGELLRVKKINTREREDFDSLDEDVEKKYGALLNDRVVLSGSDPTAVENVSVSTKFSQLEKMSAEGEIETSPVDPDERMDLIGIDYEDDASKKYLYDTPGLVHKDQTSNYLDPEEIHRVVSSKPLKPLILFLRPGQTIFIGGLGRLDFLQGDCMAYFTVFASNLMPVNLCEMWEADGTYERMKGSKAMAVPLGGPDRFRKFPDMQGKEIVVNGLGMGRASRDVVLSSAGWVSVTVPQPRPVLLRAHTPAGNGISTRSPLSPYTVQLRGERSTTCQYAFKGTPGVTRPYRGRLSFEQKWKQHNIDEYGNRSRKSLPS
eukprot:scpid12872/ scgid17438/ Nitric oxide-associated protein 1